MPTIIEGVANYFRALVSTVIINGITYFHLGEVCQEIGLDAGVTSNHLDQLNCHMVQMRTRDQQHGDNTRRHWAITDQGLFDLLMSNLTPMGISIFCAVMICQACPRKENCSISPDKIVGIIDECMHPDEGNED